jgi:hypothetical protein
MKEYHRFQDMKALAIVKPPKGARLHDTLTRWEYKEENGKLVKHKVRMTIRGDQQVAGESFVATELVVGGNVHHVIHKQSIDNELLTLAFHENSLLTIYREVAVRLHPCRDVLVPSACCLSGTINALEQLQKMTFGYGLWPPVRSSYMYHVILHASIQEGLAGVGLINRLRWLVEAAIHEPLGRRGQELVHGEVLEGLQYHWRKPHEDVFRHGD